MAEKAKSTATFSLRHKVLGTSLIFLALATLVAWRAIFNSWNAVLQGFLLAVYVTVAALMQSFNSVIPAHHVDTYYSLLARFLSKRLRLLRATRTHYHLNHASRNAISFQNTFLKDFLLTNAKTAVGRKFNFSEIKSDDEYREKIPLSHCANSSTRGEGNMKDDKGTPSSEESLSSAISRQKDDASTEQVRCLSAAKELSQHALYNTVEAFPAAKFMGKKAVFFIPRSNLKNCLNTDPQVGIDHLLGGDDMVSSKTYGLMRGIVCEKSLLYVNLLLAARDPAVGVLAAPCCDVLRSVLILLEDKKEELLSDIEKGTIHASAELDPRIRKDLMSYMKPDAKRAFDVRGCFVGGKVGLAKRIWPNCACVEVFDSGSQVFCGDALKKTYCEGLPFYSSSYLTSEGVCAINLWPKDKQRNFLPDVTSAFYEFIPIADVEKSEPKTKLLSELEIGEEYEVVCSSGVGIIRQRVGDIVRFNRSHNFCPSLEFRYSREESPRFGSFDLPAHDLFQSIHEHTVQLENVCLADFAYAQISSSACKDNIRVFLELHGDEVVLEEIVKGGTAKRIDESLMKRSETYNKLREGGEAHQLEMFLVKSGSLVDLTERVRKRSGRPITLRKLCDVGDVNFLEEKIIKSKV